MASMLMTQAARNVRRKQAPRPETESSHHKTPPRETESSHRKTPPRETESSHHKTPPRETESSHRKKPLETESSHRKKPLETESSCRKKPLETERKKTRPVEGEVARKKFPPVMTTATLAARPKGSTPSGDAAQQALLMPALDPAVESSLAAGISYAQSISDVTGESPAVTVEVQSKAGRPDHAHARRDQSAGCEEPGRG